MVIVKFLVYNSEECTIWYLVGRTRVDEPLIYAQVHPRTSNESIRIMAFCECDNSSYQTLALLGQDSQAC